jgi:hypothetical protein
VAETLACVSMGIETGLQSAMPACKNVESKLVLSKEESICLMLYGDP